MRRRYPHMFARKYISYTVATILTLIFLFVMCVARGVLVQEPSNVPFASFSISEPALFASDGLSPEDIAIIHILESGLQDMSSEITIVSANSPEQIKHLMTIAQSSPIVWGIGDYELEYDDGTYYIRPHYLISKSDKDEQWQAICEKAASVLQEISTTNAISNSESAAKAVYYWICKNVDYKDVEGNTSEEVYPYNSLYSAIVDQKAICGGYAKLFCFLMSCLGYESGYCTGYSVSGQYHAWNAVQIGEKTVYYDATYGSGYFLKSKFCAKESLDARQLETICWYRQLRLEPIPNLD